MAVLIMGVLLLGCGTSETSDTGSANEKEMTIGMSFPAFPTGWLGAIIKNAEDEAKAQGVNYILKTGIEASEQIQGIEELIAAEVDIIVLLPNDPAGVTPIADKISDAGIPLVVVDRELETDNFTALVKGDNRGIGRGAGQYIQEKFNGQAKVVEILGAPSSVTDLRSAGFREAIQAHPGIEIIASEPGNFSKQDSYDAMKSLLAAHEHIDAVYSQDDEMSLGIVQAIEEANRTDIQAITGAGGMKENYKMISEDHPSLKVSFIYSPLMVQDGVRIAVDILNGNTPNDKVQIIEATPVTKDNVDRYYDANAHY